MGLKGVSPSEFSRKSMLELLRWYILDQSTSVRRYLLESIIFFSIGWIPSIVSITLRAIVYRLILRCGGPVVIEDGVLSDGVPICACIKQVQSDGVVRYYIVRTDLIGPTYRADLNTEIPIGNCCIV